MRLVLSAIVRLFFVFIAFCFSYLKLPPPPRYLFSSVENTSLSFSVERGGILLFSVFFPPENLMIARGRKFITAPRLSRKQRCLLPLASPSLFPNALFSGSCISMAKCLARCSTVLSFLRPTSISL